MPPCRENQGIKLKALCNLGLYALGFKAFQRQGELGSVRFRV